MTLSHRVRSTSSVTVLALVAGLVGFASPASAAVTQEPQPSASGESAADEAARTGQPVIVDSLTSENTLVTANPDGTFRLQSSREAQRTQLPDGTWTGVDTTLEVDADGRVAPIATTVPMSFSSGGTSPMAEIGTVDANLQVSWTTALPSPTLSENSATYSNILPDVDLVLTANAQDFTETLVVKNAEAAHNPALRRLEFPTRVTGLETRPASDGGSAALDDSGDEIFHLGKAVMWDSHTSPYDDAPSPTDVASGVVTPVPAQVGAVDAVDSSTLTTQTLTPAVDALTGSNVVYPVFIDPDIAQHTKHYATVFSGQNYHYYDNPGEYMKVGRCPASTDSSCNGIGVGRSFFTMDTSAITNRATTAQIRSATLYAYQSHTSDGCNSRPVDLSTAGPISAGTVWPGPTLSYLGTVSSPRNDNCYNPNNNPDLTPGFVPFQINSLIQDAANRDVQEITFALTANNEREENQWKKYVSSGVNAPYLDIIFAFPPSVTALGLDGSVGCPGKPVYVRSDAPALHARAVDNNPSPGQLRLYFEIDDDPATRGYVGTATAVATASNADAVFYTSGPEATRHSIPDGNYRYTVNAANVDDAYGGVASSGNSQPYRFTIDTAAPSRPTIESFDNPEGYWGSSVSSPGSFTLTAPDAAGFEYSFLDSPFLSPSDTQCDYNAVNGLSGSVTASNGVAKLVPPVNTLKAGYNTLVVRAFDAAHNMSASSKVYPFYIARSFPSALATNREAENAAIVQGGMASSCNSSAQTTPCFYPETGLSMWSGTTQEHIVARRAPSGAPSCDSAATCTTDCSIQSCQEFTFTVEAGMTANYALGLRLTKASNYGIAQFKIDGSLVLGADGKPYTVDCYAALASTSFVALGGQAWQKGSHRITIAVAGKNASSTSYAYNGVYGGVNYSNISDNGYALGLDNFLLVPLNNATGSFSELADNTAISDGTFEADLGPSTQKYGLVRSDLDAAGMTPGTPFVVDAGTSRAATFALNSGAPNSDNIIAAGQTVAVSAKPVTDANYVDMLVMSTCGTTNAAASTRIKVTVIESDGTNAIPRNLVFPTIPDWHETPTTTLSPAVTRISQFAQLTSYYSGTILKSGRARIYHVRFATDLPTGYGVTAVTLPNFGTGFEGSGDCGTSVNPSLHVLAITTSA